MTEPSPGLRNADLVILHRQLIALMARLDLAMDDAPSAAQVKLLAEQIAQTNLRVTAVGRELFARSTTEIADAANAVAGVIPTVEKCLSDLARVGSFVGDMTNLLTLVDHAVATARMAG